MELTLKKALKLRSRLEAFVGDPSLPLSTDLSIFVQENREDPTPVFVKAEGDLRSKLDEKLRASSILADLRSSIAKANAENDIESLLARQADIERSISLFKTIAAAPIRPVIDAVKGEIAVLHRQAGEDKVSSAFAHRSLTRSANFSVVTEDLREEAKAKITEGMRNKEELEDRRNAVNLTVRIRIADDAADFLREQGFV